MAYKFRTKSSWDNAQFTIFGINLGNLMNSLCSYFMIYGKRAAHEN